MDPENALLQLAPDPGLCRVRNVTLIIANEKVWPAMRTNFQLCGGLWPLFDVLFDLWAKKELSYAFFFLSHF